MKGPLNQVFSGLFTVYRGNTDDNGKFCRNALKKIETLDE